MTSHLLVLIIIILLVILLSIRKIYIDNNKYHSEIHQIPIKVEGKVPEYKQNYTLSQETEQILGEYNNDYYNDKLVDDYSGNNYPKNEWNFF